MPGRRRRRRTVGPGHHLKAVSEPREREKVVIVVLPAEDGLARLPDDLLRASDYPSLGTTIERDQAEPARARKLGGYERRVSQ